MANDPYASQGPLVCFVQCKPGGPHHGGHMASVGAALTATCRQISGDRVRSISKRCHFTIEAERRYIFRRCAPQLLLTYAPFPACNHTQSGGSAFPCEPHCGEHGRRARSLPCMHSIRRRNSALTCTVHSASALRQLALHDCVMQWLWTCCSAAFPCIPPCHRCMP